MSIIISPHNEQEEKVLLVFLNSLEYEFPEEENIPPQLPEGTRRQTLEEYSEGIADAEDEYKKGKSVPMSTLKKQMKSW